MLGLLVAVLAILLATLWRWGGAVRALLITWLICLSPTALGFIDYDYLVFAGTLYIWVIAGSIAAFLAGAAFANLRHARTASPAEPIDFDADWTQWRRIGHACLAIAAVSILTALINIVVSGIDFSNLSDIRADVIEMSGANIWARISAITAWACFLCLGMGIYFRTEMGLARAMAFVGAGSGIFISMLTLAGRNSVLQLIIFCLVIESIRKVRMRRAGTFRPGGLSMRWAVSAAGFLYLLYVTVNRPGDLGLSDRNAVLFRLFNASISPELDGLLDHVAFLKGPIIEFMLYVTHTAPLFSVHTTIDYGGHFYGIFSFPFLARQFEPLFGYSVADALNMKRFYIQSAGVIGFGWTTALSSFIMDFGYAGCIAMMALGGFVSQYLYWRVRDGAGFGLIVMYVLMIIGAAFTPFLPSFSDTNLFLLMVALIAFTLYLRARTARVPRLARGG